MKKTFEQIAREFLLPFIGSVCWTAYALSKMEHPSVAGGLTTFSGSFFFLSWLTGQYFRVKKQVRVESGLDTVEQRLQKLTDSLEKSVQTLNANTVGGDAFCVLSIANLFPGSNIGERVVRVVGEGPLYDISMRIVDLDAFDQELAQGRMREDLFEKNYDVGNMGTVRGTALGPIDLGDGPTRRFNITWSTRNSIYTQKLRLKIVQNRWHQALRVQIGGKVHEEIDDCFLGSDGRVTWDDE